MTKLSFTLKVWRQNGPDGKGSFELFQVEDITPDMSFLEMLDVLNNRLLSEGKEAIAFESDCREGICGTCGFMVNGTAHGPEKAHTVCELRMRHFKNGCTITCEPFRAKAFPVVKDLVIDRSSFDRVIQAGGYISVKTGSAPEANAIPVPKDDMEKALDAASCIGCGACVASCPNASAMLFTSAKVSHLNLLPQGQPEKDSRVQRMVDAMDLEGFGPCSNHAECEAVCPKEIQLENIARMNRQYLLASIKN